VRDQNSDRKALFGIKVRFYNSFSNSGARLTNFILVALIESMNPVPARNWGGTSKTTSGPQMMGTCEAKGCRKPIYGELIQLRGKIKGRNTKDHSENLKWRQG